MNVSYGYKKKFFFHDFVFAISIKRGANRFVPCGASSSHHGTSFEWKLTPAKLSTHSMNAISKDRDDVRSREGNPPRRLFVIKISGNALLITARNSSGVFNKTLPYLLRVPWNSYFIIRKKWKSELSRESRMHFEEELILMYLVN